MPLEIVYALATKDNEGQFMWVLFALSNFIDGNQTQIIRVQVGVAQSQQSTGETRGTPPTPKAI